MILTHLRQLLPVLCIALAAALPVRAATLFGVVSEGSAAELAAGAALFDQRHPGHRLVLRSTVQVAAMDDDELRAHLTGADAVLLGAVFGDSIVPRLQRLAAELDQGVPLLAVNSERSLLALTRIDGRAELAGLTKEQLDRLTTNPAAGSDPQRHYRDLAEHFPAQRGWLEGHAYWNGRGGENMARLLAWLLARAGEDLAVAAPIHQAPLRYYRHGGEHAFDDLGLKPGAPVVAILDTNAGDRLGDRDLLDNLCGQLEDTGLQCFAMLARWGGASLGALKTLDDLPSPLAAIVNLQGFVVGGGEGWVDASEQFARLNVPVLTAIRLSSRGEGKWRLSADGVPMEETHYRVGMPEFQGISQPLVVAAAAPPQDDALTGLRLAISRPIPTQVDKLTARIANWHALQRKNNADKRVAIIYYNHPPGRHNIGADNLDVPASLWRILNDLKAAGYDTGELPASQEALLDQIQARGINLPEDGKALRDMAPHIASLANGDYLKWFDTLPDTVRAGVSHGPVALMVARVREAIALQEIAEGEILLDDSLNDLGHMLEGSRHEAQEQVLDLLAQLGEALRAELAGEGAAADSDRLAKALRDAGGPGVAGWGEPPGWVMSHGDRLLVPGLRFGNIFIGPQPPRGWEVDEELLHANLTFPPPHQYLAFYRYLHSEFGADALVHLGRHSTYEFLPGRALGLTEHDYPALIAGDIPGIYPYIVDGVGEGLQAKRRGLAVIVDHLTPPLRVTPLYDDLLQLRQLVESWEASPRRDSPAQQQAIVLIREKLAALNMEDELAEEIAAEQGVDSIHLEQVANDLLVHEVGHYLTHLQEAFMPEGLHVFGRDWSASAVDTMLESMAGDGEVDAAWRELLAGSPAREREALLGALDGRFVQPGKGNDPIRNPEVLPTGRNFHGLNGSLLPTRVGYELGARLAAEARARDRNSGGSEAVVLWASDTVRDEGAVVAFGLDMLGVRPVWNSRGIVEGLERLPLADGRERRDLVFTTSGLFRDLYGELLVLLDRAVRLALQGSAAAIAADHPDLKPALDAALAPVADMGEAGSEPIERNRVASHWLEHARSALAEGRDPAEAGSDAVMRIFGDAPGSYGAGINRLVERSGTWQQRGELADTYLLRLGHAYGDGVHGKPLREDFSANLARVERTYLGRASNLYGLLDNNDAFDYLGGLSLAVESLRGAPPDNRVINHADPGKARIERLQTALLGELRGRFLNPAWITPLMAHGYAGARTMGSEFMEYLWGWQVTNPAIVRSWVWDEVHSVYIEDSHELGLDAFLAEGNNAHVKANMLAILLVAAHKGFWGADGQTLDAVATEFAALVAANGLPGSGHTTPDHPMLSWIAPRLEPDLREGLQTVIANTASALPRPVPAAGEEEADGAALGVAILVLAALALLLGAGAVVAVRRRKA
ncbi:MAG: cobaltochelatase subunit CobN [Porticoccaceae bacterium]